MIDKYTQQVKREIDSAINKIPKGDGTIKGLSKRMQTFQNVLKETEIKLNKLGNEYLSQNTESKENIEQIKKTNIEQMKRLIASMNK